MTVTTDRSMNDDALLARMLDARRRHRLRFLSTAAAQAHFLTRLRRWHAGQIEASRLSGRIAETFREDGVFGREAALERLARRFEERLEVHGLAARREDRELALTILDLSPPRDLLAELESEALQSLKSSARNRLAALRRDFEELRNEVVENNLDLVEKVAARYRSTPLPREDLIQEGRAGLMRATESFDAEPGSPFRAYARFWIRHGILDALARSTRLIRLPHWLNAAIGKRRGAEGEAATPDGLPLPRVTGISDENGHSLPIVDPTVTDASDSALQREHLHLVREHMDDLPERDREIIALRFGLEGRDVQSRSDIAARLGLSPQRIGQIERQTLDFLRRRLESAGAA